jgi:hypothetical protein
LEWLNVLQRYEGSKLLIISSGLAVKIQNINIKNFISTAIDRIFPDTSFWVKVEHLRHIAI